MFDFQRPPSPTAAPTREVDQTTFDHHHDVAPSYGRGGGSPAAARDALGHWADVPAPVLRLVDDGAGVPKETAAPAPAPPVAAQNADWAGVKDADARAKLDLEWLEDLHPAVLRSIDHKHADDGKLAREKAGIEAARAKALKKATGEDARAQIQTEYDAKIAAVDAKIEADREADTATATPNRSVTTPDDKVAAKKHSQTRNRTDFMAWATNLFARDTDTSAGEVTERIKSHFLGIQPVPGQSGMLLAEKARERYVKARTQFEAENPGYTLPDSGSTHSMRDLHQDAQGVGMLGHTLGLSIDFVAYDNPNLKVGAGQPAGINDYMLKRFGGAAGFDPLTRMPTTDGPIERLGKDTNAGKTTPADEKVAATVEASWNRMAQTSDNFRHSLAPEQMHQLEAARNAHFDLPAKQKELAAVTARLARAKPADQAKLAEDQKRLREEIASSKALVDHNLQTGFSPWILGLESDNLVAAGQNVGSMVESGIYGDALKRLPKMDATQLAEYAASTGMMSEADFDASQKKKAKKQQQSYQQMVRAEVQRRQAAAQAQIAYRAKETQVRNALLKRLADPRIVFGNGTQQADKTWKTDQRVSDPSIMQLLEHGFVTNHAMPKLDVDPKTGQPIDPKTHQIGPRKQVMNAKAATALARWGFAPSNFGDTQHFDFIEGYSDAVQGGRDMKNMKRGKYSPEEKWIPTAAPPAVDSGP